MGALYNTVRVNNPGHSFFNLSHDKKFDCDMGQLIPIDVQFCMPNDVIKFGNEIVARMNPLVSPAMHEINVYTQYFFVPLRIMFGMTMTHFAPGLSGEETIQEWDVHDRDFETFLTGGRTGYDTSVSLPGVTLTGTSVENDNYVHPLYTHEGGTYARVTENSVLIPSGSTLVRGAIYFDVDANDGVTFHYVTSDGEVSDQDWYMPLYVNECVADSGLYSLSDYLGFPVGLSNYSNHLFINAFPFRAYNLIWNNFFRDQNLMPEVVVENSKKLKNVCWNKDYFTSAYTELQRGQSPALPLSNSLLPVFVNGVGSTSVPDKRSLIAYDSSSSLSNFGVGSVGSTSRPNAADGSSIGGAGYYFDSFVVDASGLFNVNDLRLAMRVQQWLEVNLKVGTHLNEFLEGHFGIGPHDETLQRPVYLGGSKSPVIVSEVLQTSQTTETESGSKTIGSPQGNMAGHGITADRNYIGSYRCKEFGVFMGVLYIRPKATYQQGIRRPWMYETKYDFPFPEFCHLGLQSIFQNEICFDNTSGGLDEDGNPITFAYTERYNELRSCPSEVCGGLRSMFDFWHLGRIFDDVPTYNADFVRCVPDKRIFAVQNEPGFIVNVGNILHAYRPIPTFGDPRT